MPDNPLGIPDRPAVPPEFDDVARAASGRVGERRFRHMVGVATIARALAERFGLDAARATLAGLLHDVARDEPDERLRELAAADRFPLPVGETGSLMAELHAPAGATVARTDFGVDDAELLEAIRRHTYGEGRLGPLAAILFVADKIEPRRAPWPPALPGLDAALASLDDALLFAYTFTISHHLADGRRVDVRTVHARNDLLARLRERG